MVQQADNLELYKNLLDLSSQALDMQAEIAALKKENEELLIFCGLWDTKKKKWMCVFRSFE